MNIHEYQAKQLLAQYGVAVPLEIPAKSLAEVRPAAEKSPPAAAPKVVVKSQIHAGGRGKGCSRAAFKAA
jgi:succinyl-CoA synthetase beta subunit